MKLNRNDIVTAAGRLDALARLTGEEIKDEIFGLIAVDREDLKWLNYTVDLLTKLTMSGEVSWDGSGEFEQSPRNDC